MKLFCVVLVLACYLGKFSPVKALRPYPEPLPWNITLVVFSGLPDPQWLVEPSNPLYQNIRELFNAPQAGNVIYLPEQMPAQLGYKGFLVQEGNEEPAALILGTKTKKLQQLLLQSIPPRLISTDLMSSISKVIDQGSVLPVEIDRERPVTKRTAPSYGNWFTRWWRWNNCYRRPNNNCYNYANDKVTNNFAQPGEGSGHYFQRSDITAALMQNLAELDGLTRLNPHPNDNDPVPGIPADPNRHLVALVVDPGNDFHWYRLDSNGHWSHKPGRTTVTDRGGMQNPINDPRLPNLNVLGGPNYVFVCFMTTDKNTVNIR